MDSELLGEIGGVILPLWSPCKLVEGEAEPPTKTLSIKTSPFCRA